MPTPWCWGFALLLLSSRTSSALRFDSQYFDYNLNQHQSAVDASGYAGIWDNHTFTLSPLNWRIPFYTLFLDKFVNGDPTNDDINGTLFEHDTMQTTFRHGGDLQGLVDSLDYIQGMGIEAIYIAGTPFINMPWGADGYSPLDLTLLDQHFGDLAAWRNAIEEIHSRGMYIMLDNTMATMGDLIAFKGHENSSVPFTTSEYEVLYKDPQRQYNDFTFGNTYNTTCAYPRFWLETGVLVGSDVTDQLGGCYDSEFDQYGDFEGLGDFDGWKRSLSKAAGVQDRLREWVPSVRQKIETMSCLQIMMLDIDGFRIDKATQVTVDAMGEFSKAMRACAASVGKDNFFITGEVSGGNTYGSVFIGRGRQPDQYLDNETVAVTMTTKDGNSSLFIRDAGLNGLDSQAFHYSIYRSLLRLLGMDGVISGPNDTPVNLVESWTDLLLTNDLVNPNSGVFDPRQMFGSTNQDNFRWPAIAHGTEKQLLANFITTLHMPGVPLLLWGEEQAFYVLDSTADNYLYGRQAMSSAQAWQMHGCYKIGSSQFNNFMEDAPAATGCTNDWNSLDHRDPANPVRNIIKSMYQMRRNYPALNDGYLLQQLSNQTHEVQLPASNGTATELGVWSTMRGNFAGLQNLASGNESVWLVYQNENTTVDYIFNCSDPNAAFIAPFDASTTVKNLFYPFDEITLVDGPVSLGLNDTTALNGCVPNLTLGPWEYRAYVPLESFIPPTPMITKFLPGHDARLKSASSVPIELHFSAAMDCASVTSAVTVRSTTEDGSLATVDPASVVCSTVAAEAVSPFFGSLPTMWKFKANLVGVSDGVHTVTVKNASSTDLSTSTQGADHFYLRIGQDNNPIVFPSSANYSQTLLEKFNGGLYISHSAAGADSFRYSTNWGSTYSSWQPYTGGNTTITPQAWSGTSTQQWNGEHVIVQYHSKMLGSSDHIQQGDLSATQTPRRFPHLFVQGKFNDFGTDTGVATGMTLENGGQWEYELLAEWPMELQINEWGLNPNGKTDKSFLFGDIDGDKVLDRIPPFSLLTNTLKFFGTPESPFLSWKLSVNDANLSYEVVPAGNRWLQMLIYILLWTIPPLTAGLGVWAYVQSFYQVKLNKVGANVSKFTDLLIPKGLREKGRHRISSIDSRMSLLGRRGRSRANSNVSDISIEMANSPGLPGTAAVARRTVLIATMEYDIEDWKVKVKIGGLGVMAQLMGKNLGHQNLIWVVPCVGDVNYPVDEVADPMEITILGKPYQINIQYHVLKNITYVILDAPVFRAQSKAIPYPERMDDMDSAIFYSAWNQCIAQAIQRFQPDLYHINDYHGALAPLYLLPETIPCALSLHNAEFQGLWGMRNPEESKEVCEVYHLPMDVAKKYVQFGDVFNLLHAGASYLRVHQKGFGAVGVSKKYGKRSWARYPIFWGLKEIGQLPNPDPSDLAAWDPDAEPEELEIDYEFERNRSRLRKEAQEWANLTVDPEAELLVFVGRWSMQKGIDLIADAMPALLEENPKVQLICVGPVIDLYGKFAALKLDVLMKKYPGRVFSKPEFTALPPFIFSGAEFALIPSRDEPFGLVAVEFGRKGALGIGARVGGLGQMPGWWFTVESTTTSHLLHQFKRAIKDALSSKIETRIKMRARSAKQRFPVAQWVADLETLQGDAIKIHEKEAECKHCKGTSCNINRGHSPYMGAAGERNSWRHSTSSMPRAQKRSSSYESRRSSATPSVLPGRAVSGDFTGRMRSSSQLDLPVEITGRQRSSSQLDLPTAVTGRQRSQSQLDLQQGRRYSRTASPSPLGQDSLLANGRDPFPFPSNPRDSTASEATNSPYLMPMGRDRDYHRTSGASAMSSSTTLGVTQPRFSAFFREHYADEDSAHPLHPYSPDFFADDLLLPPRNFYQSNHVSTLSLEEVVGNKIDFSLQKVDPSFTDSTEEYFNEFKNKLSKLDHKNSEGEMCIEEYLIKSEKAWHTKFRAAKLGRSTDNSPMPSRPPSPSRTNSYQAVATDEFHLAVDYKVPRGLRKWLQYRIGDWPLYTVLLALGQIMGANSYQITLLSGPTVQDAEKFYIISGIYLISSILYWLAYRVLKSVHILSVPFLIYGVSLLLLGVSPLFMSLSAAAVSDITYAATVLYTIASASGSLYFALNFGDEGGSPVKSWIFRACVIQGTQQVYNCALWFWGSKLAIDSTATISKTVGSPILLACSLVLFLVGLALYTGLPTYYRQTPGKLPSFYASLMRRKIILWFLVTVLIQNFFLSTLTGRNWTYLWTSSHLSTWQVALLAIFFFIILWTLFLFFFARLAMTHTWIIPIFAIGLGAPRWAQILWSCTPIGQFLPWAPGGSAVASALLGRGVWLWLGLLDSLQGVGFGMILLQTLTRIHISATLIGAQILGSGITMIARAVGPDRLGPGTVFPDFSKGIWELRHPWFWVGLAAQVVVCAGFLKFFRKEQLSKP